MATILLDSGAHTLKGTVASGDFDMKTEYNGYIRSKGGNIISLGNRALADCSEGGFDSRSHAIAFPQSRGLLQDSNIQSELWGRLFTQLIPDADVLEATRQSKLLMTLQPNQPEMIVDRYCQMIFEDFGFQEAAFLTPHSAALNTVAGGTCHLVLDCGQSFSQVVPFLSRIPMKQAAQRVDIGGKKLTNLLGELLSGKDYNLIGEVSILSEIKEAECFLMPDEVSFNKGVEDCRMSKKRNPIWREWCLPDYKTIPTGFELNRQNKDHISLAHSQQLSVVNLTSERFMVPEALFRPGDIGLEQAGLADLLWSTAKHSVPTLMTNQLLKNVVLTGGSCRLQGFTDRLRQEMNLGRSPDYGEIAVRNLEDESKSPLAGLFEYANGRGELANVQPIDEYLCSGYDYQEQGSYRLCKGFYL